MVPVRVGQQDLANLADRESGIGQLLCHRTSLAVLGGRAQDDWRELGMLIEVSAKTGINQNVAARMQNQNCADNKFSFFLEAAATIGQRGPRVYGARPDRGDPDAINRSGILDINGGSVMPCQHRGLETQVEQPADKQQNWNKHLEEELHCRNLHIPLTLPGGQALAS